METRYIEISLDTAKRWYQQGGELKDMALGAYTLEELGFELPKTFEEFLGVMERWNIAIPEQMYNDAIPQIAAVKKLMLLQTFYNNGWQPNWKEMVEDKFSIIRNYIKETDEYKIEWLVPNSQKNEMEPIMITINPGCATDVDMPHEGQEFGYVLEGKVVVVYGND